MKPSGGARSRLKPIKYSRAYGLGEVHILHNHFRGGGWGSIQSISVFGGGGNLVVNEPNVKNAENPAARDAEFNLHCLHYISSGVRQCSALGIYTRTNLAASRH